MLIYSIVKEEHFNFDGSYYSCSSDFLFQIDPRSGFIQVKSVQTIKSYSSVLVVVEIEDLNKLTPSSRVSVQCYVEFRFAQPAIPRSPQFVGSYQRFENICQDVIYILKFKLINFCFLIFF